MVDREYCPATMSLKISIGAINTNPGIQKIRS